MRLQGIDAVLSAGRRLDFQWNGGNRMSMAPEACVAVYGHPYGRDGGLRLVFRFRPGAAEPNGGGHVMASAVIGPEHAEDAWRFVQTLVAVYGIENVAWTDGSKVVAEVPARIPRDDPDWLAAPASPRTEELLSWVTRRLAEVDV